MRELPLDYFYKVSPGFKFLQCIICGDGQSQTWSHLYTQHKIKANPTVKVKVRVIR